MRIAGCIIMMGMLFSYPEKTAAAARQALTVFGLDVVPVLFPYMVITRMLVSRIKQYSNPPVWITMFIGWIAGSPSGASALQIFAMNQSISRRCLYALCAFTGTISPAFLINTAGFWFNDLHITPYLVLSHFLGAALTALILYGRNVENDEAAVRNCDAILNSDENAIASSTVSILGIGGCIVFYSVFSEVIHALLPMLNTTFSSFLHALLEVSGGLKELSRSLPESRTYIAVLVAFSCGFTGFSILSQNMMFLKHLRITMAQLVRIAFLRAVLCAFVMYISLHIHCN